jgi:hypothetical protein
MSRYVRFCEFRIQRDPEVVLHFKNTQSYITYDVTPKPHKTRRWSPTPLVKYPLGKGLYVRSAQILIHLFWIYTYSLFKHKTPDLRSYMLIGFIFRTGWKLGQRHRWPRSAQSSFPRSPPHIRNWAPMQHMGRKIGELCLLCSWGLQIMYH